MPDKPLFNHKLGESRESAMLLQAAVVVKLTPVFGDIQTVQQFFTAARAFERIAQGNPLRVALLMDQLEQFKNAARRDLRAFIFIKPDALASKAQVEYHFTVLQTLKTMLAHHLATGGAVGWFHWRRTTDGDWMKSRL